MASPKLSLSDMSAEELELIKELREKRASSSSVSRTKQESKSTHSPLSKMEESNSSSGGSKEQITINSEEEEDFSPIQVEGSQSVKDRLRKRRDHPQQLVVSSHEEGQKSPPKKKKKLFSEEQEKEQVDLTPKLNPLSDSFVSRKLIEPLIIGKEFWEQSLNDENEDLLGKGIRQFRDYLEVQGWANLVTEPLAIHEDSTRLFYQGMNFVAAGENNPASDFLVSFEDRNIPISANILAKILKVESRGFAVLVKKKTWPKGKEYKTRTETVKVIFGRNITGDLNTNLPSLDKKLLHKFLLRNIVPRQENRGTVLINDAILMEKIISGSFVDLPRIVMAHMQITQAHPSHVLPYPHLVKKLLETFACYPQDVKETPYSSCLTIPNIKMMKWTRERAPTPSLPHVPLLIPPPRTESPSASMSQYIDCSTQCDALVQGLKGVENAIRDSNAQLRKVLGRFEDILVTFLKAQVAREQAPQENKDEETKAEEATKGSADTEIVVKKNTSDE